MECRRSALQTQLLFGILWGLYLVWGYIILFVILKLYINMFHNVPCQQACFDCIKTSSLCRYFEQLFRCTRVWLSEISLLSNRKYNLLYLALNKKSRMFKIFWDEDIVRDLHFQDGLVFYWVNILLYLTVLFSWVSNIYRYAFPWNCGLINAIPTTVFILSS